MSSLIPALAALASPDGKYLTQTSEEVRLAALNAIKHALLDGQSLPQTGVSLSTRASFALLGNLIAVLLDGTRMERSKRLKLAVLEAVLACIQELAGGLPARNASNCCEPSKPSPLRMAKVFPGTFASVFRVAMDTDVKQGSKVTAAALKCVEAALRACAADAVMEAVGLLPPEQSVLHRMLHLTLKGSEREPSTTFHVAPVPGWDPAWLRLCEEKICPRVRELLEKCCHASHWRVRAAGASLAVMVASVAPRVLRPCFLDAVETLLVLAEDPLDAVASNAQQWRRSGLLSLRAHAASWYATVQSATPRLWAAVAALPRYALYYAAAGCRNSTIIMAMCCANYHIVFTVIGLRG